MRILLDCGHGGVDGGAVNREEKVQEKDITLEVVLMIGSLLEELDHIVSYTRETDIYISPSDRLQIIKNSKPDCFISVHCNASGNFAANGIETIYRNSNSKRLASRIQESLIECSGLRDRGIKEDVRSLAVLKDSNTPSVLVEIFFISNEDDLEYYDTGKEIFAEAIVEGVQKWI